MPRALTPAPASSSRNSPRPQPMSSTSARAGEKRQIAFEPRPDRFARAAKLILEADVLVAVERTRMSPRGLLASWTRCTALCGPALNASNLVHLKTRSTSRFSASDACWTTPSVARSSSWRVRRARARARLRAGRARSSDSHRLSTFSARPLSDALRTSAPPAARRSRVSMYAVICCRY